jgi:S1-C subfamily serine protease
VTVWHDRKQSEKSLTLVSIKDENQHADTAPSGSSATTPDSASLGIAIGEEDGKVVVERVAPDGPSDGKLRRGDVIEEIDHQAVHGSADVVARLKATPVDRPVLLRVRHGEQARYVAIERQR